MSGSDQLEANKATIRLWRERIWNQGDFTATPELITSDFVCHRPRPLDEIHGRRAHDHWVAEVRGQHPGFHVELFDLIAEGDRVASSWWGAGPGMHFYRMEDGKIAEMWTVVAPAND
jgi:predicted SnoaL-like aldol condensation-catalyzing enzyme